MSVARSRGAWTVLGLFLHAFTSGGEDCPWRAAGNVGSSLIQMGRSRSQVPDFSGAPWAESRPLPEEEEEEEEMDPPGITPWTATVIIDSNYLPVFNCWLGAYKKSGSRTHIRVGSLDANVSTALRSHLKLSQFDDAYVAREPHIEVLDLRPRSSAGLSLLQTGISPKSFLEIFWRAMRASVVSSPGGSLHSDADALWVNNPDHMLRHALHHHPNADIISQVSYGSWWHPAFQQWGFVLNTGYTLFRNTSGVLAMIDSFMAINQTKLEQGVLNNYLLNLGCQWNQTHRKDSKILTAGRCGNLTVLLLPLSQVARTWKPESKLMVYHPDLRRVPLPTLQGMGFC